MSDRICSICRGATATGCEFCNPTLGASVTHGGGSVVVAEASWRELQTELASHKKKVEELEEQLRISQNAGRLAGETCVIHVKRRAELEAKLAEYSDHWKDLYRRQIAITDELSGKHTALRDGLRLYANFIDGSVGSPMGRIRQDLLALLGKESEDG